MNKLLPKLVPKVANFDFEEAYINKVYKELKIQALKRDDQCFGYFPGYIGEGVEKELPASQAFAARFPSVFLENGLELKFSFLILSLKKQPSRYAYHLDGDASSGLNKASTDLLALRALCNLSDKHVRNFGYLNIDPDELELKIDEGYRPLLSEVPKNSRLKLAIAKRQGSHVSGAIFIANRVLHVGEDGKFGRFVVSYGAEVKAFD